MLNYMRAECYKVLRRKYLPGFTLVILICELLLLSGWVYTNANGNQIDFYTGGVTAVMFFSLGLYLLVAIVDMVFSDQYKHNTLKNEVSFGIPRTRIYLGKLLVEILLGAVLVLLFMVFYEVLCYFALLPGEPGSAADAMTVVGWCLLCALPQWLGVLAVTHMLYTLVRSSTFAAVAVVCLVTVPPFVFNILAILGSDLCARLIRLMPLSLIDNASTVVGDWGYLGTSWAMGMLWLVVSTALGLALFKRREIT